MRYSKIEKIIFVFVAIMLTSKVGQTQINTPSGATKPFGSNTSYEYGMMPSNLPTSGSYGKASEIASIYNQWKEEYVENCGSDRARVKFDEKENTVSEGIGYGMLLAAYAADKDLFNRLWAYYKSYRNERGVMHWKISGCNNRIYENGATDAELDAAMALIVANYQWPNTTSPHPYKSDAVALINAIKNHEINKSDGTFENGDMWKPACRNPSYQAPGYARVFKVFMAENGNADNAFWDNVVAKTEGLLINNAHSSSGLATNWCTPQGPPSDACSGSGTRPDKFGFDACRAPWRQATNYIWFGSSGMQTIINKQADLWIGKGGAGSVQGGDNMNHDGSGSGYHNSAFVGMVGAMSLAASNTSAHQSFCNAMYSENKNSNLAPNYFSKILQMIGLFVQTGNFWNPYQAGGTNNESPTVSLTSPSGNITVCLGAGISLAANATDSDGTISKVEFYNGTTLITSITSSPYSYNWTNAPAGTLTVTAKAYDNNNAVTTSASRTITVNNSPAAPGVTANVNYCLGASASALTATGTSLKWYTQATGGTSSTTAPTPSTNTAGTQTYYVSQTSGNCESPRAAITVTVIQTAAPVVTSQVNYCQGAQASPLTATGTSLKWYTAATGGTSSTTAPTPSTANTGTQNYWVSQTGNGCESPRAQITVSVGTATAAPTVVSPVTYCQGVASAALSASGTNLKWYTSSTGGTGTAVAPTPSTQVAGTTSYYVSQTGSGCESARTEIKVTIKAAPSAPTVQTPVVYGLSELAIPLIASGTNLKWYTTQTGGAGLAEAPTPITTVAGTTTYYVSQTNAEGCESPRAAIVVNVLDLLPVYRAATAPVIDGEEDEIWSSAAEKSITKVILPTISSPADLSGTFKVLWNDQYFYLLADITDDIKTNDSDPVYEDDGIELFFDIGNNKPSAYQNNDVQYTFRWNSTTVSSNPNGRSVTGINFSMKATTNGYILEARIPWSTLQASPLAGQLHGFDIHINDDDNGGGRDGKMSWASANDDAWQNPSLFGTMLLKELPVVAGIPNGSIIGLKYYPNPFSNFVEIEGLSGEVSYSLVNINGQTVQSGKTTGKINTDCIPGVYSLILNLDSGNQYIKLVKVE